LIANKEEAIYSLLKLILKDPRNTSHHTFRNYPYKTLVMFLSEINEALESIDGLVKPSYVSYLKTNYDPATKKLVLKPKY
jgi:hypothetical protein